MALNRPPHPTDPNFNQWIYQFWSSAGTSPTGMAGISASGGLASGTVVLSNSNGVSFGVAGNTVTASVYVPPSFVAGVSTGGNTSGNTGTVNNRVILQGGTNVTLSQSTNSNGATVVFNADGMTNVTMYANSNTLVSSSNTAPISSLNFVGSGIASVGFNNGSIIVNVPAGGGAGDGYNQLQWTNSTADSTMPVLFAGNSNGSGNLTFGLTGSTVTGIGPVGTASTFAGTNVSGSMTINSNGLNLALSAPSPAQETYSSYSPYVNGLSTVSTSLGATTSSPVSFFPFYVNNYVSAGVLNLLATCGFSQVTGQGSQTAGMAVGIYSAGTGTNSTAIYTVASAQMDWFVTGSGGAYTLQHPFTTNYTGYVTTTTASSNNAITAAYTGGRILGFPMNTLLTPGQYWLGVIGTRQSSSSSCGLTFGIYNAAHYTQATQAGAIGQFTSNYTSGSNLMDPNNVWAVGMGSWTSAGSVTGLPQSVAFESITRGVTFSPIFSIFRT